MAELESEGKDNLPIRRHLIDTAVSFLLNPSVQERPDDAKIAFLKKKGLTDLEIAEAFNKIKYAAATALDSDKNNQMVNAYPLPPYQPPSSFWFHLRSYSSTFVSFAIAVYLLHRFYKSYIEPWFFGSKSEGNELSVLKQQLIELNNSVSRLASTVASLEDAVNNQIHQIDRSAVYDVESVPRSIRDILDEVSNVKSLLLNRFSFPAPPPIMGTTTENKPQSEEPNTPSKTVTIPKWQLRDSEHEKSKVNSKEQIEKIEDKEKPSSELKLLESNLSSVRDQTQDQENNLKIVKDKIQDEDFETASENNVESLEDKKGNYNACLENNLYANEKIQDEDLNLVLENLISDVKENDCKSTYQTNGPNERINESTHCESAIKSE